MNNLPGMTVFSRPTRYEGQQITKAILDLEFGITYQGDGWYLSESTDGLYLHSAYYIHRVGVECLPPNDWFWVYRFEGVSLNNPLNLLKKALEMPKFTQRIDLHYKPEKENV